MKHTLSTILTLTAFTLAANANDKAVFNTLTPKTVRPYSIEVIRDDSSLQSSTIGKVIQDSTFLHNGINEEWNKEINDERNNYIDELENIDIKEYSHSDSLIEQYLSVAYPLASMQVTSPFGVRTDPITGKKAKHNGIDLRANFEDVYATMIGKVDKVGYDKRSGHYVTLRHADYSVTYCHLSEIYVSKGEMVFPRQAIAKSGDSGRATGPHLHLSFSKGKKCLDPSILFDYIAIAKREAIEKMDH